LLEEMVHRQFEIGNLGAQEQDLLPSSNVSLGPKDRSLWTPEERGFSSPNQLNNLTLILARMRTYRFVLAGDISEMFLQIRLHQDDKQFHCFTCRSQHFQWTRTLSGN
jgi:hypothetical protein